MVVVLLFFCGGGEGVVVCNIVLILMWVTEKEETGVFYTQLVFSQIKCHMTLLHTFVFFSGSLGLKQVYFR